MSALMEGPRVLPDFEPAETPRRPRRVAVKPSARTDAPKVKSTIILPLDTSRRLTVYAAMTGADRSEVVARLIDEHLRRFVVQDRAKSAGPEGRMAATEIVSST